MVSHTAKKDLQKLVEHDHSSGSSSWFTGISSPSTNSETSPPGPSKPALRPNLSRYQPHVQVSPRTTEPSTFTTTGHTRETTASPRSETSSGGGLSPATRIKTIAIEHESEEPEMRSWQQRNYDDTTGYHFWQPSNQTVTTGNDPTSDFQSTSRHDDTIDPSLATPAMSISPAPHSSSERKVIRKRKVVRKQENGSSAIFDESLVADSLNGESYRVQDIDDMRIQYDRLRLPIQLPSRPQTARPASRRSPDQDSLHDIQLPSYIRPNTSHPHMRNIRKSDPVNRYHQYRDAWDNIKAPGEKRHSSLRWEVRAQMMFKDEPQPKPQRIFVPNTYVVPTSKKRSALRWEVRHALERGLPVPSTYTVL